MLWLRTLAFTVLIPGTVLVLIPAAIIAWGRGPAYDLGSMRWIGLPPIAAGLAVIAVCFVDFIRRGQGTPAPYDPPRKLVVAGPYRYVRNPQYIGVVLVVMGQAIVAGSLFLLGYAALLAVGYHQFVLNYEEPTLTRLFGEEYKRYCLSVSRWLPRLSPIVD